MKSIEEVIEQYKDYISNSNWFDIARSKFGYVLCCYDSVAKDFVDPTGLLKSGEQLENFIKDDIQYNQMLRSEILDD